jgi:uncharacterized protein YbjT (DUF2867 family)
MTPDAGAQPGEPSPADSSGPRELLAYRSAQGRWVVGRVVGVSMLSRGTPWAGRAGFVTGSLAMDDLIAASGVAYRALTNPYFMEDTARQAESIKDQGVFSYPIAGDRKLPTIATRDIAAAASRLLLDASWSGAGEVPLLGPEDLSFNDMAEIMSQVLGKEDLWTPTPDGLRWWLEPPWHRPSHCRGLAERNPHRSRRHRRRERGERPHRHHRPPGGSGDVRRQRSVLD